MMTQRLKRLSHPNSPGAHNLQCIHIRLVIVLAAIPSPFECRHHQHVLIRAPQCRQPLHRLPRTAVEQRPDHPAQQLRPAFVPSLLYAHLPSSPCVPSFALRSLPIFPAAAHPMKTANDAAHSAASRHPTHRSGTPPNRTRAAHHPWWETKNLSRLYVSRHRCCNSLQWPPGRWRRLSCVLSAWPARSARTAIPNKPIPAWSAVVYTPTCPLRSRPPSSC